MMKLEVYREGRHGYHIGDVVNIPDDAEIWDFVHFRVLDEGAVARKNREKEELAEIARLEAQLAAANKESKKKAGE